jgi:hypothetical protein
MTYCQQTHCIRENSMSDSSTFCLDHICTPECNLPLPEIEIIWRFLCFRADEIMPMQ